MIDGLPNLAFITYIQTNIVQYHIPHYEATSNANGSLPMDQHIVKIDITELTHTFKISFMPIIHEK